MPHISSRYPTLTMSYPSSSFSPTTFPGPSNPIVYPMRPARPPPAAPLRHPMVRLILGSPTLPAPSPPLSLRRDYLSSRRWLASANLILEVSLGRLKHRLPLGPFHKMRLPARAWLDLPLDPADPSWTPAPGIVAEIWVEQNGCMLGIAALALAEINQEKQRLARPITCTETGEIIGKLSLECLVIRPFKRVPPPLPVEEDQEPQQKHGQQRQERQSQQIEEKQEELEDGDNLTVGLSSSEEGSGRAGNVWGSKMALPGVPRSVWRMVGPLGDDGGRVRFVAHVVLPVQITRDGVPVVRRDFFVPHRFDDLYGLDTTALTWSQWRRLDAAEALRDGVDPSLMDKLTLADRPTVRVQDSEKSQRGGRIFDRFAHAEKGGAEGDGSSGEGEAEVEVAAAGHYNSGRHKRERREWISLTTGLNRLDQVIDAVQKEVGVLIDIRYPSKQYADEKRLVSYPQRNEIIDAVLRVLLAPGRRRRGHFAFLSCDADCCTILKLKQEAQPVYLALAERSNHQVFNAQDPRCATLDGALYFSSSQHLDGLVLPTRLLQRPAPLLEQARSRGLQLMALSDPEGPSDATRKLLQAGVDGIIFEQDAVVADWVCGLRGESDQDEQTEKEDCRSVSWAEPVVMPESLLEPRKSTA